MNLRIAAVVLVAGIAGLGSANGQDKIVMPKTAAPSFVTVNDLDTRKDIVTVGVVEMTFVTETRERTVVVDGKKVKETFTELRRVPVSRMEARSIKGAR